MADTDTGEGDERKPLLPKANDAPPEYSALTGDDNEKNETHVSEVEPNELPPPYMPMSGGGYPVVSCRVCQATIDLTGRRDQHVVKCSQCNEATPIKPAPPGKKYVRCPCNCLLICKSASQRIACPRPQCKRIISLAPNSANTPVPTVPGMCRVNCALCHDPFLFNTLNNALARCPHCRKVSSVGPEFARSRGILLLVISLIFLGIGIAVTMCTYKIARHSGGIYVIYVGAFLASVILLCRAIYYFTMKISIIDGPL